MVAISAGIGGGSPTWGQSTDCRDPVHVHAHLQLPELGQVVEQGEGDNGSQVAAHWPGVGKLR